MIKIVADILFAIFGLAMAASWVSSVIFTGNALDGAELEALSAVGSAEFAALRGCIALSVVVVVILYFVQDRRWVFPALVITIGIIVSRAVAMALNGPTGFHLNAIAIEAVVLVVTGYLSYRIARPD